MDLRAFKIVTGEEIITELLSDKNPDYYEIAKPRQLGLIQTQGPDGQPALVPHLVPWVVTHPDGNFQLMKGRVILYIQNVPSVLGDMYLKDVTGIELASGVSPNQIRTK